MAEQGLQQKYEPKPPPLTAASPLRFMKGVGPERSLLLQKLGLFNLEDLFYYFPKRYEDRRTYKKISDLNPDDKVCVRASVKSRALIRTRGRETMFRAVFDDESSRPLFCLWFNQPYLTKVFLPKRKFSLYGKIEKEGRMYRMVHPEFEVVPEGEESVSSLQMGRVVPVYGLTEDVGQKGLRQLTYQAVQESIRALTQTLPTGLQERLSLISLENAIRWIHYPESAEHYKNAYRRLVFDEFFYLQLGIQIRKKQLDRLLTKKMTNHADRVWVWLESLDFSLTQGQERVAREILQDMQSASSMNRLVQGDVGSGKTVVAMASIYYSVLNGFQAAFMAPTEILAKQHYASILNNLEPLGVRVGYLAGHLPAAQKKGLLDQLANGQLDVVVGTHALLESEVRFKQLGVVVIDEQHKFGVFQRKKLKEKMRDTPHALYLSATPIPRSLAMTCYGDLNLSVMTEMPKGRKQIQTLWADESRREEIYQFVEDLLRLGQQGYVLTPMIDATKSGLKSTEFMSETLQKRFEKYRVGILHGKMNSAQKQKVMKNFKEKHFDILVCTVVVEVGIDVSNATFMVIENADRFGLSQLHQLRGRVGRGEQESFCFLFSQSQLPETIERLETFCQTHSGFELAQKDLEMRGVGDVLGQKQHGYTPLKIGDLLKDQEILFLARKEALRIANEDENLSKLEHRMLKIKLKKKINQEIQEVHLSAS